MLANCLEMLILARIVRSDILWSPGDWGAQGGSETGGGGPARVPNLRVCKHLVRVWHTQECPAVSISSETQGGKAGLPARTSGHHVVRA